MTDPAVYARRWKTLAVLTLSLLIIGLDNTILNVALPSLQKQFDASASTLQWMVDSYLLVFAGLLLTMGTLGDRFGRKLALQCGLVLFGGASLAVLLVETSGQLIAVRAVMGVGGALIMPATLSIISNVSRARSAARRSASGPAWPPSASASARWPAACCSSTSTGARSSCSTSRSASPRCSPARGSSPTAATRSPARSTSSARACRSPPSLRSSTRSSRRPSAAAPASRRAVKPVAGLDQGRLRDAGATPRARAKRRSGSCAGSRSAVRGRREAADSGVKAAVRRPRRRAAPRSA